MGFIMDIRAKHILIGFISALIATLIGSEMYLVLFTNFELFTDFKFIYNTHMLWKITVIGSLLNLLLFTFFIKKRMDFYARGCILAVIIITLLTQIF